MRYFARWIKLWWQGVLRPRFHWSGPLLLVTSLSLVCFVILPGFGISVPLWFYYSMAALVPFLLIQRIRQFASLVSADDGRLVVDRAYFRSYAGTGRPYEEVRHHFSGGGQCLALFKQEGAPPLDKICILGVATGGILQDFHRALGAKPWGCEVSQWAYHRIPKTYLPRVKRMDMREYVPLMIEKGQVFDIIFSCSLMYLNEEEVLPFLASCRKITAYFYFEGSYLGKSCNDPYRRILKREHWWEDQFHKAGFREVKNIWGGSSYLWR